MLRTHQCIVRCHAVSVEVLHTIIEVHRAHEANHESCSMRPRMSDEDLRPHLMHDARSRALHSQADFSCRKRGGLQVCNRSVPSGPFRAAYSPLLQHHIPKTPSWHVSDVAYERIGISILRCRQCFHNLRCLSQSCQYETDTTIRLSRVSQVNEWP